MALYLRGDREGKVNVREANRVIHELEKLINRANTGVEEIVSGETEGATGGGTTTATGDDCPTYLYVRATGNAEGDIHLKNSTWDHSKTIVKEVTVGTSSTDWELWILQNDNGYSADDATIPALQVADGMTGDATVHLDRAYEDEDATGEVHLYFADNSGSNTCDLTVVGYTLS